MLIAIEGRYFPSFNVTPSRSGDRKSVAQGSLRIDLIFNSTDMSRQSAGTTTSGKSGLASYVVAKHDVGRQYRVKVAHVHETLRGG